MTNEPGEHSGWWCSKCGRFGGEREHEAAQVAHNRDSNCGYAVLMVPAASVAEIGGTITARAAYRRNLALAVCLGVPNDTLRRLAEAGGLAALLASGDPEQFVGDRPGKACGSTYEPENGEYVSPCHLPKNHAGQCEGYCLGSRAVWSREEE